MVKIFTNQSNKTLFCSGLLLLIFLKKLNAIATGIDNRINGIFLIVIVYGLRTAHFHY